MKKIWISLSLAVVLLLVIAVVIAVSCSQNAGWDWDDEEEDKDNEVSSNKGDTEEDDKQSAIDQMIATIGIESVIIEIDPITDGDYQAHVRAQVPNYSELFLASYTEADPDKALQNAILKKEYTTVEYEGYATVRTIDGEQIVDTDTLVQGFIEQELIKAINTVLEAEGAGK